MTNPNRFRLSVHFSEAEDDDVQAALAAFLRVTDSKARVQWVSMALEYVASRVLSGDDAFLSEMKGSESVEQFRQISRLLLAMHSGGGGAEQWLVPGRPHTTQRSQTAPTPIEASGSNGQHIPRDRVAPEQSGQPKATVTGESPGGWAPDDTPSDHGRPVPHAAENRTDSGEGASNDTGEVTVEPSGELSPLKRALSQL